MATTSPHDYTTAPTPSIATKSLSYSLTYSGTKQTDISLVKSDYVVLHTDVTNPSQGALHKVKLSTILSSATIPIASASVNGLMSTEHYKSLYSTAIPFVNSYTATVTNLKNGNISESYNMLLTKDEHKKLETSIIPIETSVTSSLIPSNVINWQKIATLSPVLTYNNIDRGAYIMLTYSDYQFLQSLKSNLNLAQS